MANPDPNALSAWMSAIDQAQPTQPSRGRQMVQKSQEKRPPQQPPQQPKK